MTPEQEVEQEVLSCGFSHGFQVFLVEERLFEKAESERTKEDGKHIIAGFVSAMFFGGIFWGLFIWRFFL